MQTIAFILGAAGLVMLGAGAARVTKYESQTDPAGLSTELLSRCAGIGGVELRSADAAFGELMLDGAPWLTIQHDRQALIVTSTGTLRRRNGTIVPFGFACVIDGSGHASMLRITSVGIDAAQPPSRSIRGMAVPVGLETALPRGTELQIQLLDMAKNPQGVLLGEQVVRSGWAVPIPFDLRIPADAIRADSRIAITARLVVARAELYRMASPRILTAEEMRGPVMLELTP